MFYYLPSVYYGICVMYKIQSYYDIFDVINITIYLMLFIVIYSYQFYIVCKKCVNFVLTKIENKENKVI